MICWTDRLDLCCYDAGLQRVCRRRRQDFRPGRPGSRSVALAQALFQACGTAANACCVFVSPAVQYFQMASSHRDNPYFSTTFFCGGVPSVLHSALPLAFGDPRCAEDECGQEIFKYTEGQLWCKSHWLERFTAKCISCGKATGEVARRIRESAADERLVWCQECFACAVCNEPLDAVFWKDERLLCPTHHRVRFVSSAALRLQHATIGRAVLSRRQLRGGWIRQRPWMLCAPRRRCWWQRRRRLQRGADRGTNRTPPKSPCNGCVVCLCPTPCCCGTPSRVVLSTRAARPKSVVLRVHQCRSWGVQVLRVHGAGAEKVRRAVEDPRPALRTLTTAARRSHCAASGPAPAAQPGTHVCIVVDGW